MDMAQSKIGLLIVGLIVIVIGLSLGPTIIGTVQTSGDAIKQCPGDMTLTTDLQGNDFCSATPGDTTFNPGTDARYYTEFQGTLAANNIIPLIYYAAVVIGALAFIGTGTGVIGGGGGGPFKR